MGSKREQLAIIAQRDRNLTYGQLMDEIMHMFREDAERTLGILVADQSVRSILLYISCIYHRQPVILLDSQHSRKKLSSVIEKFCPDWIWIPDIQEMPPEQERYRLEIQQDHYQLWIRQDAGDEEDHYQLPDDLAVLLTTSGSTGSSKYVMLSYDNLECNADSIIQCLHIQPEDRAAVILPVTYSYGLSIINTYLKAGGTLLLPADGILHRECWAFLERNQVQALCGVPYHYEIYRRIKLFRRPLEDVKLMTQAGGAMSIEQQKYFLDIAQERSIDFAIMYGQTEATARMSCYYLNQHMDRLGSVGRAIPGGRLSIEKADQTGKGEVIYEGDNVFMGYAIDRRDISQWRPQTKMLHTGDIGYIDEDGYLYITGRKSRFAKICGHRISLDELQQELSQKTQQEVICMAKSSKQGEKLCVIWKRSGTDDSCVRRAVLEQKLYRGMCIYRSMEAIPRKSNGKVDYEEIRKMWGW